VKLVFLSVTGLVYAYSVVLMAQVLFQMKSTGVVAVLGSASLTVASLLVYLVLAARRLNRPIALALSLALLAAATLQLFFVGMAAVLGPLGASPSPL